MRAGLLAKGMCTNMDPVKLLSICGSTFRLLLPLVMEQPDMFSIILNLATAIAPSQSGPEMELELLARIVLVRL